MNIESAGPCQPDGPYDPDKYYAYTRIVFKCNYCRSKVIFEAEGKKIYEEFKNELDSWQADYINQCIEDAIII